jgi:hypothetical protein
MSGFVQIEYTVTFRMDAKSPQQELKRYTKEAAESFADGVISMGGVAIVNEGIAEEPISDDIVDNSLKDNRRLTW